MIKDRVEREKVQYDDVSFEEKREKFGNILSHTHYFYELRKYNILKKVLDYANGKRALEIGSSAWCAWIEQQGIKPSKLDCINISEKELERGIELSKKSRLIKPSFHLMDAHKLDFKDETFDVVFGGAILHHLDLPVALDEIYRVLKPDGLMLFTEPLDTNPIGKIVRVFTPYVRTIDEQALRFKEIAQIKKRFNLNCHFEQLLTVPFGILSKFIFKKPNNFMMHVVYIIDRVINKILPPLGWFYRYIIIIGYKK